MDRLVCCLLLVVGSHVMPGVKAFMTSDSVTTGYTFAVFEDSQYDTDSWYDARKLCRRNVSPMADLAEITNVDDETTVVNLLNTLSAPNSAYWIGVHNSEISPGTRVVWSLRKGKSLTFDRWESGRPKSDKVRCGTVNDDGNKWKKWKDEECKTQGTTYGVLCQFPTQPITIDPYTGCPPTMVPLAGKCYDFQMTADLANFTKARATCEALPGGRMVIPTSAMQGFIALYAHLSGLRYFWLGVTDEDVDGQYKSIYGDALDSPKWSVNYFIEGQSGVTECVVIYSVNGEWFQEKCTATNFKGILCVVDPLAYQGGDTTTAPSQTTANSQQSSPATVSGSADYCKNGGR